MTTPLQKPDPDPLPLPCQEAANLIRALGLEGPLDRETTCLKKHGTCSFAVLSNGNPKASRAKFTSKRYNLFALRSRNTRIFPSCLRTQPAKAKTMMSNNTAAKRGTGNRRALQIQRRHVLISISGSQITSDFARNV